MFPVSTSGTVAWAESSGARLYWALASSTPVDEVRLGSDTGVGHLDPDHGRVVDVDRPARWVPRSPSPAGAFWSTDTVKGSLSAVPDTVGAKVMIRVHRPAAGSSTCRLVPRPLV